MDVLAATDRRGGRLGWWHWRVWLAVLCLLPGPIAVGQHPSRVSDEYKLKAVFLFNFAQFVEWPPEAFRTPNAPFVIGVLGQDPFGAYLDSLVKGEQVRGHPLVVRRFSRLEEAVRCQLVFISRSEAGRLSAILDALRGRSVLTLSDAEEFSRAGGMVRFATENGRIRLKINLDAARASGLTISSKIVRPSTIVTAGKD